MRGAVNWLAALAACAAALNPGAAPALESASIPLLAAEWGSVSTGSLRLSPDMQSALGTGDDYLVLAAVNLLDEGVRRGDPLGGPVPVARVAVAGHDLRRGTATFVDRFAASHWYASWTSPSPQDGGCRWPAQAWDGAGEPLAESGLPCDEACEIATREPEGFPRLLEASISRGYVNVQWTAVPGASRYGILVWTARPALGDLLESLAFSSEVFDAPPRSVFSVHVDESRQYYIAVWAEGEEPADTSCQGSPSVRVHPRGAVEVRHLSLDPSAVHATPWAAVKVPASPVRRRRRARSLGVVDEPHRHPRPRSRLGLVQGDPVDPGGGQVEPTDRVRSVPPRVVEDAARVALRVDGEDGGLGCLRLDPEAGDVAAVRQADGLAGAPARVAHRAEHQVPRAAAADHPAGLG